LTHHETEKSSDDIVGNIRGVFYNRIEDNEETTEILSALGKEEIANSKIFKDGVKVVGSRRRRNVAECVGCLEFSNLGHHALVLVERLKVVHLLDGGSNWGNSWPSLLHEALVVLQRGGNGDGQESNDENSFHFKFFLLLIFLFLIYKILWSGSAIFSTYILVEQFTWS